MTQIDERPTCPDCNEWADKCRCHDVSDDDERASEEAEQESQFQRDRGDAAMRPE